VEGTILQTNSNDVLLLRDHGTSHYSPQIIKEIHIARAEALETADTNRLSGYRTILLRLSEQPWASGLQQIPATVVDKGNLRNVPYISFRCADDYEINIYGDLDHPSGIEAGVYRKLLGDASAKANCVQFIASVLGQGTDKEFLQGLNLQKDLLTANNMTFEITPPYAEDAYMGWWVSIYSQTEMERARASDAELAKITVPNFVTITNQSSSDWSIEEIKLARRTPPTVISFIEKDLGKVITNAEVKPYIDGVSLIWRDSTSGGVVKLANLPKDIQDQFGYSAEKTRYFEMQEAQKRAGEAQKRAVAYAKVAEDSTYTGASSYSAPSYGGGRVYVRGYTKGNGTYVSSYSRGSPGSGRRR